jgi:hypothetical protein
MNRGVPDAGRVSASSSGPMAGRNQDDLDFAIEAARWHTDRYDALRASTASRASFVLTANGVLIAGVAFLTPAGLDPSQGLERVVSLLAVAGGLLALLFAAISISLAANSLVSSKRWRVMFGEPRSLGLFYQHSDTFSAAPTFDQFQEQFVGLSREADLGSAIVNLWVVMKTHAHRYAYLRRAVRYLKLGLLVFVVSIALVLGAGQFFN